MSMVKMRGFTGYSNHKSAEMGNDRSSELFKYIDSSEYDLHINKANMPYVMRHGGIFICLEGRGSVIINECKYPLQPHTLCVAFPGTIIQSFEPGGDDFRSYALAMNVDFLRELNFPSANSIHMSMREHPCIMLSSEQEDAIMQICDMMSEKKRRSPHPYHEQINAQMLTLLCYELAGVYADRLPVKQEPCTRQDMVFRRFLSLLASDYMVSREVQYYADKLSITPKYLTIISRQLSGYSAAEWITRTVIVNAKSLLASTQMSVQEVAFNLNFANPSFFGQYFLRYTGLTPKEFRRSKL